MIMATEIMITVVADAVIEEVHTEEVVAGAIKMITPIRTRIKTSVIIGQAMEMDVPGVITKGWGQRPWCPQRQLLRESRSFIQVTSSIAGQMEEVIASTLNSPSISADSNTDSALKINCPTNVGPIFICGA